MSVLTRAEKRELAGRARTFHERLEGPSNEREGESPIDPDRVLEEWRAQFPDEDSFDERLAVRGISPEDIRKHVGATHWPADKPLPDWIGDLEELVRHVESSKPLDEYETTSNSPESVAFEELLFRIGDYAREQLDEQVVPMGAISPMVQWLLNQLERLSVRILYVEFKSFLSYYEPELLDVNPDEFDDLPTTHYVRFINSMFDGGMRNLCIEYPVFARFLTRLVNQWVSAVTELCRRVRADRTELRQQFDLEGDVTELEPLADDKHGDGRLPARVSFENGTVVYKPRSVSGGRVFYTILQRLDERLSAPSFDAPRYLPRDDYGWMEAIEHENPASDDAVERYYERAGVILCLSYALNFTDCQLQNVIASGETPVLVDGETVFHSWVDPAERPFKSEYPVVISRTVLWTALLPWSVGNPRETDARGPAELVAGFGEGSSEAELEWMPKPEIEAKNTDVMSVSTSPKTLNRSKNTPSVDGEDRSPGEYTDAILRTFRETYETICELHDEGRFFSEIVTEDEVSGMSTRLLYRNTGTYASVLNSMVARNPLRDGVRLTVEMEELVKPFFDGRIETDRHWSMYETERRSLRRFDIPRFTSQPDLEEVFHGGSEIDTSLSLDAGFDRAREELDEFSRTDLHKQMWLIRRCYRDTNSPARPPSTIEIPDDRLRETALDLFEGAIDAAYEVNDRRVWVSTGPGDLPFSLIPADESLYYGRSGIALTAAAIYRSEGRNRYYELVEEILNPVINSIRADDPSLPLGGTMGVGSVVYGLSVIAELLEEDRYRYLATEAAQTVTEEQIASDDSFGVTEGSAGTLLGLLSHYERYGGKDILEKAIACGERLLDARIPVNDGEQVAWQTTNDSVQTGFAHGSTGIAYSLARLGSVTGQGRYVRATREAIDFESTLYDPDHVNWASGFESENYPDRWCHGRSGIALGRIGIAEQLGDERLLGKAKTALSAIASAEPDRMDHVCCGNFGRVETLVVGAQRGLNERTQATRLAGRCLNRRRQEGKLLLQGHTDGFANPTWFNGLSGVAYTLLRLEDSNTLPSVLLFE